jgi:hypothetical protein
MCNNPEVLTYDWIKTGGRSFDLTLVNDFSVLASRKWTSSWCCVDPLRPPGFPGGIPYLPIGLKCENIS